MCCLPTLFQTGIALFLYKWVRECRFACKVDALANFPIAFFISAMSSFTLLILDLISLLLKPDRSKSSVRFSFSVETLWGSLRVWRNTSPEAFPADRVLLSIFRSRRSLPYNISNFSNCRVRFFNIQEGGEVSPWLQPNVIPAKAGISLRLPRTPTAGAQAPPPQNHARRVPQPCLHGCGRAAGVSVTPRLANAICFSQKKRGTSSPKMDLGLSTSPMEII